MMYTCHVKLLQTQEDYGGYTQMVFKDLDLTYEYYMVTRLPRWECPLLKVGDTGFLKYQEVHAGETTWYDRTTGKQVPYLYTNDYLVNFVLDKKDNEDALML